MMTPIYLFTGFLESGKTKCILETMESDNFFEGERTVLLVCEEGIEEYSEAWLKKYNTIIVTVSKFEELGIKLFQKIQDTFHPDRIMIEYNGMWSVTDLLNLPIPEGWVRAQTLCLVDASTFNSYINNMRSIIYENIKYADLVICNRCTAETNAGMLRGNIKAINKRADIVYEGYNGEILDNLATKLPFDINDDPLEIKDTDYGLWYMDITDHPEKYDGKEVIFKGYVSDIGLRGKNAFVIGRQAMVCCSNDTSLVGLIVESSKTSSLVDHDFIKLTAQVETFQDSEGIIPFLVAKDIELTEELEDPYVYFN